MKRFGGPLVARVASSTSVMRRSTSGVLSSSDFLGHGTLALGTITIGNSFVTAFWTVAFGSFRVILASGLPP